MKLNKIISRSLILSLFISNLNNLTFADNRALNRYETLEGEQITIDDSVEGNLEEIEIFGNTIQDPNNLEDVQSVGDLYVDEDGNPILNNKGQRQYKIDIHSTTNLWSFVMDDWYEFANNYSDDPMYEYSDGKLRILRVDDRPWTSVPDIKVPKANTKYTFSSSDNSCTFAKTVQNPSTRVSYISDDEGYIKGIKVFGDTDKKYDVKLVEGDYIDDILETSTTTIILPTQLQKVGDVADRLYWDNSKGRYIVEKNITSIVLDGSEEWIDSSTTEFSTINDSDYITFHNMLLFGKYPVDSGFVSNNFNYLRYDGGFRWTGDYEGISDGGGYNFIFIRINKSKLETPDVEGFKKWLNNNPTTVWYQLKIPKIINSNITSKLNIPTYEGKTYIFVETENGVSPTLKVTVDRLPQIAKNSVEEAKINSSTSNISLARTYVNMLPESLYKDQLHEQLNQIFSSDVVLNKKSVTSNADIYIKSKNTLSMSLDTNSVMFEGYSGTEDMEMLNAVNITVDSSLPYSLNAYMPIGISNSDNSLSMNMNTLNIRESSETNYQVFTSTTDKVVLKDNCADGSSNNHSIDLKLASNLAHQADIYKTVIKFEAEQK